jgi:hypothetical protein
VHGLGCRRFRVDEALRFAPIPLKNTAIAARLPC